MPPPSPQRSTTIESTTRSRSLLLAWFLEPQYESLRRKALAVLLGQFLSLLLTATGVFSQLLAGLNVNAPTTQSFLNYLLLSFYSIPLIVRGSFLTIVRERWMFYLLLALVDVEANFLVVKAYQYTDITRYPHVLASSMVIYLS